MSALEEYRKCDPIVSGLATKRLLADAAIAELEAKVYKLQNYAEHQYMSGVHDGADDDFGDATLLMRRAIERAEQAEAEVARLIEQNKGLLFHQSSEVARARAEVARLTWMLHEAWESSEEWQWNESEETWMADLARRYEEQRRDA